MSRVVVRLLLLIHIQLVQINASSFQHQNLARMSCHWIFFFEKLQAEEVTSVQSDLRQKKNYILHIFTIVFPGTHNVKYLPIFHCMSSYFML